MFHPLKATQFTPSALAEHYAFPGDQPSWLRVNMVTSLDGAASTDGRSGGLGGPGDRLLFQVLRALADVVLVGSATALSEHYRQPVTAPEFAPLRRAAGQAPAPALALMSASLDLPVDYAPLRSPDTVVFTCAAAPAEARDRLTAAGATLVDCGETEVDPAAVRAACVARGWRRIGSEGGPRVLASFIAADEVDELCLTVAPVLAAGTAPRIAEGAAPGGLTAMECRHILTDDEGYLYQRWTRR